MLPLGPVAHAYPGIHPTIHTPSLRRAMKKEKKTFTVYLLHTYITLNFSSRSHSVHGSYYSWWCRMAEARAHCNGTDHSW